MVRKDGKLQGWFRTVPKAPATVTDEFGFERRYRDMLALNVADCFNRRMGAAAMTYRDEKGAVVARFDATPGAIDYREVKAGTLGESMSPGCARRDRAVRPRRRRQASHRSSDRTCGARKRRLSGCTAARNRIRRSRVRRRAATPLRGRPSVLVLADAIADDADHDGAADGTQRAAFGQDRPGGDADTGTDVGITVRRVDIPLQPHSMTASIALAANVWGSSHGGTCSSVVVSAG